MTVWLKWFLELPFVKTALFYGAIALAVFLFLLGIRRGGEKAVYKKVELERARNAEIVRQKIDAVPKPTKRDSSQRLRNHKF